MRKVAIAALVTWQSLAALAEPSDAPEDEAALFERLAVREQILEGQAASAAAVSRERTLLAYRMARRRELGFVAHTEGRLDAATSFDAALVALRRSVDESQALSRELDRVRGERARLESALIERALREENHEQTVASSASPPADRLARPARGAAVTFPGVRRDGPSRVELRHDDLQILTRLNDPVMAVAEGVVKRVEALDQGGFSVLVAHRDGRASITSGLRDFLVKAGDRVEAGQALGIAGRNLDGAAVVSVEIWHKRRPLNVAKLLRSRP